MGFKVCSVPCDRCLFSKDKLVSNARRREILKVCASKDTHFICHKGSLADQDVCCHVFFKRCTSQMIRIAGRLNLIEFVDPEKL